MAQLPTCQTLLLEKRASRLYVTINRPEARNALSDEVLKEFHQLFDAIESDRNIRVIILRGSEGVFCAGGDIKAFKDSLQSSVPEDGGTDPVIASNRLFGSFLLRLNALPQVVVGLIEGAAFGGGLGLVCVTDVSICMSNTKFALSETGLGIPPAQIAPFVVQRIGLTMTRNIALTGTRFTGREAHSMGLVHYLVDDAEAMDTQLNAVLNDIGRCAPGANAATKAILLQAESAPLGDTLDEASTLFASQLRSEEGQEGVKAFMEKRASSWTEKVE